MINEKLSTQLRVKPIKQGESVTYKVTGAGEILPGVVDDSGNKKRATPGLNLAGDCFITDKWSDRPTTKIQLIHATEFKVVTLPDQTEQNVPIHERVEFDNGYKTITADQLETYAFLERHPNNGSNPYRDKSKKIMFSRVDAKAVKLEKFKNNARIDTAIGLLRDADKADTINIAKHINKNLAKENKLNLDQALEFLKGDIRDRILEKHPDLIIMGSGDVFEKKKIHSQIAESFNVIEFMEDTREWYFGEDKICKVDVGEDRYDVLGKKYTEGDKGPELYKRIIDTVKKVK